MRVGYGLWGSAVPGSGTSGQSCASVAKACFSAGSTLSAQWRLTAIHRPPGLDAAEAYLNRRCPARPAAIFRLALNLIG
ncbi:hypothetical protein ACFQ08_14785 [Streptosporangium algeriense]|uniref:Uncharacterized protein n=1 Tax=Streptosporangium algeriense TaxID=1682748 RepID=A0ABW3DPH6_9ACTN